MAACYLFFLTRTFLKRQVHCTSSHATFVAKNECAVGPDTPFLAIHTTKMGVKISLEAWLPPASYSNSNMIYEYTKSEWAVQRFVANVRDESCRCDSVLRNKSDAIASHLKLFLQHGIVYRLYSTCWNVQSQTYRRTFHKTFEYNASIWFCCFQSHFTSIFLFLASSSVFQSSGRGEE